jgi:hypothetical protein
MSRCALLAFSLVLLAASASWADLPLPKNLKYVDPRVSFEGIDKHADHVFYLRFQTFTAAPTKDYRLIEIKDAKPFNLNAQRRLANMSLLALERKEFDKRAKDDPSLKWLTDKTDGVLLAKLDAPSTTGSVNLTEVPVTSYRVSLKEGKLSAELVKDAKRSDAGPLPIWGFGLVLALSIAGLGIWFARRRP